MAEEPGNQTPNTPGISETELRESKVDELRERADKLGVGGTSGMKKDELIDAIVEAERGDGADASAASGAAEDELRESKVDELRERAKDDGVGGTSGMKKDELVDAIVDAESDRGGADETPDDLGAGPDGGHIRTGSETSKSLKYSQEVTSTDDEPEREGRSLATTHHQVIREWAESRGGVPATVPGTEHGDHLGVLRIDFGGDNDDLRHVSWEEWFDTFDERKLNFVYQEQRSDGNQSTFFILESPDREDA